MSPGSAVPVVPPRAQFAAEVITSRSGLDAVADRFDALLAQTGAPASARWDAEAAWLHSHPRAEPCCVLIHDGKTPVAGALLAHSRRAGLHLYSTPTEPSEPHWLAAVDDGAARALAAAIATGLRAPWALHLRDLPAPDPVADALLRQLPLAAASAGAQVPRMHFWPGRPLDAYLSRNTRSAVAKARNRIDAAGMRRELAWTRDAVDIDRCMPDILDIHARRNQQLRARSRLDDPSVAALFGSTLRAHARAGRVRLLTLRLDGMLAAFAICLQTAGKLWVYANYASPDWLAYSPGTIVNAEVVRAAHADPEIVCLDWGAGVQRYKLSGGVTVEHLQVLRAWSSLASRLAWTGLEAGRRTVEQWRQRATTVLPLAVPWWLDGGALHRVLEALPGTVP